MARISIINNGQVKQTVDLGAGELVIGRGDDVSIQLKHPLISRKHARLYLTPAGYIVEDEGTKNGTFLEGRRIQRHRLVDGDEIAVGDFFLHYHADGFVPLEDEMPAGMDPKNRQEAKQLSPLEAYMQALKRGGANATAAIPPEAMARLREQARRKAIPLLKVPGRKAVPMEEKEILIGWGKSSDVRLPGWWLWVGPAVRLTRLDVEYKLDKLSWAVPVKVNGVSVSEATVKAGDELRVGGKTVKLLEGDAGF